MAGSAKNITGVAVGADLPRMTGKGTPAFDLPGVDFWQATTKVIAAVPLKPAARVGPVNPALLTPNG